MRVSPIRYATISCSDLEASLEFWRDLVGFEEIWRETLSGAAVERAWALPAGSKASVSQLSYGGFENGQLRLVEFHPRGERHVRDRGDDPWAIGVGALDCYVRDPARTFALLSDAGFESKTPAPVYYEVDGLEQSEVVFHAPDQVNLLLVGAMAYPPQLARPDLPGDFSPLVVISQFVSDMEGAKRFYGETLGLQKGLDAWVDDANRPRVNAMVGIPPLAELHLVTFQGTEGPEGKHLLLETRGIPAPSIAQRMQPPNLGISSLAHETDDLAALERTLAECGADIVTPPTELRLTASRRVNTLLARAPRGILLEFYQSS
jgi:catechol 2,3-dioxygenase-like lactoylglutathione lyase family enzyme